MIETKEFGKYNQKAIHICSRDNNRLVIDQSLYSNYTQIKNHLQKYISETKTETQHKIINIKDGTYSIILGILLIIFYTILILTNIDTYQQTDISTFTYTQQNKPLVEYTDKRNKTPIIKIKSKEYPSINFYIADQAFDALDVDYYISNVNIGDTLQMTVSQADYFAKIIKTKEPTFWQKHGGRYEKVDIIGLKMKDKELLTYAEYNEESIWRTESISKFMLYAGLIILCVGLFLRFWPKNHTIS